VVSGAVKGVIEGTAMGIASGYAGGKGSLDEILKNVWQGALIGLVLGAAMGYIASKVPTNPSGAEPSAQSPAAQPSIAQTSPQPSAQHIDPLGGPKPMVSTFGDVSNVQTTAKGTAVAIGEAAGEKALSHIVKATIPYIAKSLAYQVVQVTIVDLLSGAWYLEREKIIKLFRNVDIKPTTIGGGSF
jgi:hypothetical protein